MCKSSILTAIRWSFAICYFSFAICLAACVPSDDALDRVRETGILRVGMDASFPPFEFISADGTLAGFDVDLARELGSALGAGEGVEVQFIANLSYDGLYDALALGQVDVVISALVVNPARMADFAYVAYFDAGQVLVVRLGEADIEAMSDLSGRALAVEFGTRGDQEARKWARRVLDLSVVPHQTAAEAMAALRAGEVDAALVDHVSALAEGVAEGGFTIVGEAVVSEPYAVAVREDDRRLLRAIGEALAEMEADGTMDALEAKWLKGDH
jgi:polar amino acid transport system substrate-binding protein